MTPVSTARRQREVVQNTMLILAADTALSPTVRQGSGHRSREDALAARFELFQDNDGQFRFHLKAANGKIIAASEDYKTRAGATACIASVKKNAADAPVVEVET